MNPDRIERAVLDIRAATMVALDKDVSGEEAEQIADAVEDGFREAMERYILRDLVIEMRRYVIHHGLLIGECVAWNRLKMLTGVGQESDCPSETLYPE